MQNILNKIDKLAGFLKSKYPVSRPVQIGVCEYFSHDSNLYGICMLTKKEEIKIRVMYKNRTQKDTLYTLAHEYGHALQFDREEVFDYSGYNNTDWVKEFQADQFAEEALKEYKKWKGK